MGRAEPALRERRDERAEAGVATSGDLRVADEHEALARARDGHVEEAPAIGAQTRSVTRDELDERRHGERLAAVVEDLRREARRVRAQVDAERGVRADDGPRLQLRQDDDAKREAFARVHRHEANRVVVVREGRGLWLAGPRLGERDAIEQRANRRLLVRDAQELSDVGDALDAARQEQERLLDLELANGFSERATRAEAFGRPAERAKRGTNALERLAIAFLDEPTPLEDVPALEVRDEPAVRLRQAEQRSVAQRGERPAKDREERRAIVGAIEESQEREQVLYFARAEEAATGDDVRDARAREREGRGVEHLVRLREDREVAVRERLAVVAALGSHGARDVRRGDRRVLEARGVAWLARRTKPGDALFFGRLREGRRQERLDAFGVASFGEIVAVGAQALVAERVHELDDRGVRAVVLSEREQIGRRARRELHGAPRDVERVARVRARELDARRDEHGDVGAAEGVDSTACDRRPRGGRAGGDRRPRASRRARASADRAPRGGAADRPGRATCPGTRRRGARRSPSRDARGRVRIIAERVAREAKRGAEADRAGARVGVREELLRARR